MKNSILEVLELLDGLSQEKNDSIDKAEKILNDMLKKPCGNFSTWYEVKILGIGAEQEPLEYMGRYATLDDALEFTSSRRDMFCDMFDLKCKVSVEEWNDKEGMGYPVDESKDIVRTVEENLEHWNYEDTK